MTKKKKIIIGLCILAAILLAFIGGNVLAKYQTQVTGTGSADIAKWVFAVNGNTSTMETISLSNTYKDADLTNGKIAPGTKGSFDIIVDATGSDVGVDYSVSFSDETNKPANLKFKYAGREASTLQELSPYIIGTIDANATSKTQTKKIEWEWSYTGDDEADTATGIADLDYTFNVTVTGAQVLPHQQ